MEGALFFLFFRLCVHNLSFRSVPLDGGNTLLTIRLRGVSSSPPSAIPIPWPPPPHLSSHFPHRHSIPLPPPPPLRLCNEEDERKKTTTNHFHKAVGGRKGERRKVDIVEKGPSNLGQPHSVISYLEVENRTDFLFSKRRRSVCS